MELRDYLKILQKRGWIIVVVALIAAASAYGVSKLQRPIYSASVKLSINPARADWGLSNVAKDLLRNYAENIRTHKMAQQVIDRGQLDLTTSDLLSRLYVESEASNLTMEVEARDRDGQQAQIIAQTTAEVFVEDRDAWNQEQDKRDRINVSILDNVYTLGYSLYSPKTKINTLAGGLFGVLLGGLLVFFLEWLEQDIIRSPADVERITGVMVLGAIPASSAQAEGQAGERPRRRFLPGLPGINVGLLIFFAAGLVVGTLIGGLAVSMM
jgi:capsular polysaccharide biosynthesis protein